MTTETSEDCGVVVTSKTNLLRLSGVDIGEYWPQIQTGIERSFPPQACDVERTLSNIQQALLENRMQCWVGIVDDRVVGSVVTAIATDNCIGAKNLLIYSLYWPRTDSGETWEDGLQTLREFARGTGCQKIIGYTQSGAVRKRVIELGGEAKTVMIELEV